MSIRRWSKIWTLGDRYTTGIFDGPVSITEKIDGSQFNFGVHPEHGLMFLTKGSSCHIGDGNKLFAPAMDHVASVVDKLTPGWTYHGETLANPRHNTLAYDRVPKGHIALYGVTKADGSQIVNHSPCNLFQGDLTGIANSLGIDIVPELFEGVVDPNDIQELLQSWLDSTSYLGKEHIEGVVIKNYAKEQFVGGQLLPLMQAKFVSEKFKEKHKVAWPNNNKSPLMMIGEVVRTEARWNKAIQRLKENGTYEGNPRDIGELMKILHTDLEEEDKEDIKERLWKAFSKDIKRAATRNFPEAYKWYLATGVLKLDIGRESAEPSNLDNGNEARTKPEEGPVS